MISLIIAVFIVLVASAICSGSEAALFSVPLLEARKLAQSNTRSALALLTIREKMNRPITTIVILNNVANIVGSIIIGGIATSVLGQEWLGVFSGVLTFFVILFSEIIPKTIGEEYAGQISLFIARPVLSVTRLLTPVVWAIEHLTTPFTKKETAFTTNEAEIKLLAKIGRTEGVIEADESDMIHRIFELNDLTAADVMTPRVTMTYLKGKSLLNDVKEAIMQSQHSRIVVIQNTPDDVLGFALKDELLTGIIAGKGEHIVAEFVHEVRFVPEPMRADRLLQLFQTSRQHLAIVFDEYGGVSGVVTLEDVLEVLTGEIVDETDTVVNLQELARQRRDKILAQERTDV